MAAPAGNLNTQFENEILPELEITVMPYKLKGKFRIEIMNDKFVDFAKKKGIIDDDMIDDLSWKRVGEIYKSLMKVAQEFYIGAIDEEIGTP